ncbi:MAG: phosphate-binding protein [Acidimicrobiia bacterium]|nr:phosphate-binding protein [Acidimicrobiia bacterium]
MNARVLRLLALVAALVMVLAACGGADAGGDTTGGEDGGEDATNDGGSGTITVSGSSTVEPISALVAQAHDEANGTATTVEGPGTGDGFARFCAGETDISDASRPIADDEIAICEEAGIEFVELEIAIDGMAVLTSPANEEISCLAYTDLYALLGPESEGFQNWSDANDLASELGAPNAPYPDVPLVITAPGEESGTYDSFVELVIEGLAEERVGEDSIFTRADYSPEANDNVIINNLSGNDTSLGWVGYAFYVENSDAVKAIEVDDGESGCVAPTEETIADSTYPLSRSLYIYVKTSDLSSQTQAFVDYYLSDEGLAFVEEAGYVSLPDERIEATRSAWTEATGA